MSEWLDPGQVDITQELLTTANGYPLVARLLAQRNLSEPAAALAFLDPSHYIPAPPTEFEEMERAVERIEHAIRAGERICVWGDFDVDGQTSTALLFTVLRALGGDVSYHVPDRESEGHGIRLSTLRQVLSGGIELMITCDTGTSEHEALGQALEQGVEVIVTDHHVPSEQRPPVHALVNPCFLPVDHPSRELPGVGVAYKLAQLLCTRAGRDALADSQLDLVALGIVSDVAVVTGDVRYLLQLGLHCIRTGERLGLRCIMESAGLSQADISEEHIGFAIAPRLNSLGRLADANQGVELLTTEDTVRARVLAAQLEGLNARRQLLTKQVFDGARAQVERDPALLEHGALVLSHPDWPGGVVGIAAGRLADYYGRPVVLIAAPPGVVARGSARSVSGCDINAAIEANGHMLRSHGGHPMAAGLSIDGERIEEFRLALGRTVADQCGVEPVAEPLRIDAWVELAELSLDLVRQVNMLAPFGPGNPPVRLATRDLGIVEHALIGRTQEHRRMVVADSSGRQETVLWWQGSSRPLPEGRFDLAYSIRATDFRGERRVQAEWLEARPREAPLVEVFVERPVVQVEDFRRDPAPVARLRELQREGELAIWCEGMEDEVGVDRDHLPRARRLVVWTLPPGPEELQAAIARSGASQVCFFSLGAGLDQPRAFLRQLAGMIKYALSKRGGRIEVAALAAATGHRKATIRMGVEWLVARGQVEVVADDGEALTIAPARGDARADLPVVQAQLGALLEETAAYRDYYRKADRDTLL